MEIDRTSKEEFLKRKKVEEKILFTSMLSILLCCVMLAGSTLAWYTASVSTPLTSIRTGTFDVTVQGATSTYGLGGNDKLPFIQHDKVDASGTIIEEDIEITTEEILWEPGDMYTLQPLYVVNSGTMDMNFQMLLSFSEDVDAVENLELLQALKFYVTAEMPDDTQIEAELTFPNDEAFGNMMKEKKDADGEATGYEVKIPIFAEELFLAAAAEEEDISFSTVTMKVMMPANIGQRYAGKALHSIEVIVNASQVIPYETDTADYTLVSDAAELMTAIGNGGRIVLEHDIVLNDNTKLVVDADRDVTLDLQGYQLRGNVDGFLIENHGKLTINGGNGKLTNNHSNGKILHVTVTGAGEEQIKGEALLNDITFAPKENVLKAEDGAAISGNVDLTGAWLQEN